MFLHKQASGRTNALLQTHEEVIEAAESDQPVLVLRVGSRLDPGIKRKHRPNEDSLFIAQDIMLTASQTQPLALFVVADGMGGHEHGQEASQLATRSLAGYLDAPLGSPQMTRGALLPLLRAGVQYANQVVYQRNQERDTDMGTTVTTILISGSIAYVAHVGDIAAGMIQPDDIYTHPLRNQLYRSLGQKPTLEVDTGVVPLAAGDTLLLCSDDLWEMVRDPQIAGMLTTPKSDPSKTAEMLVRAALAGGRVDNVSVIVVQVRK